MVVSNKALFRLEDYVDKYQDSYRNPKDDLIIVHLHIDNISEQSNMKKAIKRSEPRIKAIMILINHFFIKQAYHSNRYMSRR